MESGDEPERRQMSGEQRVVRDDQRSVTQAELKLVDLQLSSRIGAVEREMATKASREHVETQAQVLQLKMDHLGEQVGEVQSFLRKGVGAILLAVLMAILALIFR